MSDETEAVADDPVLAALHFLYVESLPDAERDHEQFADARLAKELDSELAVVAASDLDQLQKWHLAASVLSRRPELFDMSRAGFVSLVGSPALAVLHKTELPADVTSRLATDLEQFVTKVLADEGEPQRGEKPAVLLTHDRWRQFHETVLTPFQATVNDIIAGSDDVDVVPPPSPPQPPTVFTVDEPFTKPGCNDEVVDPDGGASTIVSRFWSSYALEDFKEYVDPTSWPKLGSKYWKSMRIREGTYQPMPGGYTATFDEVVALPGVVVNAQLQVTYVATDDYALTSYQETRTTTDDVKRDAGYVFATRRTVPPEPGYPTLVYATKTIRFAAPLEELNDFTDLACDNGWVDLMIRMAIPQDRRGPDMRRPGAQQPGTAPASYGSEELDDFVAKVCAAFDQNVGVWRSTVGATLEGSLGKQHLEPVLDACDQWVVAAGAGTKAWRRAISDFSASWGA